MPSATLFSAHRNWRTSALWKGFPRGIQGTLPDGTIIASDQPDIDQILSNALKREVKLERAFAQPRTATAKEYWPDIEGLDYRDTVTEFGLPDVTFFDCAVVHLLTTAAVDQLRAVYPDGRFEIRRFRPNIVVETAHGEKDFVENGWVGRKVAISDAVRLSIIR